MTKKVLVLGDSAKDVTVYCDIHRMAPDLPIPVLDYHTEKQNPGMAGNLKANLDYLRVKNDFITNSNAKEITKTRYLDFKTRHVICRVDKGPKIERISGLEEINFNRYSLVCISDYHKGFLTDEDLEYIGKNSKISIIDTKKKINSIWAPYFSFIKINRGEYEASKKEINELDLNNNIIQTCGELGAFYQGVNYPVEKVFCRVLVGAGDAFLAGFIKKYTEKQDVVAAIRFANKIATIAVTKGEIGLYTEG